MTWKLLEKVIVGATAESLSATAIECNQAIIQAQRGNAASLEVGDSTLDSGKGIELVKPAENSQIAALTLGGTGQNCVNLAAIYIIGTADDGVNVLYEEF
jgi:precorrin-6B methylase 2